MHTFYRRTDGLTDGQTDGRTAFSSLYRVCIPCSAVKTMLNSHYYEYMAYTLISVGSFRTNFNENQIRTEVLL